MGKLKRRMLQMILGIPETAPFRQIKEQEYFSRKMDSGLKQLDQGHGIEHAKVRSQLLRAFAKPSNLHCDVLTHKL